MSTFASTYVSWRHHAEGVTLAVDERRIPVPEPVAGWLLAEHRPALTADPAYDVLLLEQELRLHAAHLAGRLASAAADIDRGRRGVATARSISGRAARGIRQTAGGYLADAIGVHAALTTRHRDACRAVAAVRGFVDAARVPDGWLAEAATGWRLDPHRPPWVTAFDTEDQFLAADTRRAVPGWWGSSRLGGHFSGVEFRRDGDDDDPAATGLVRAGPWRLAWLAATHEVFATRRAPYLGEWVWLLGRLRDRDSALELLAQAQSRMRCPNSLIVAAELVHQHQTWQADPDEPAG